MTLTRFRVRLCDFVDRFGLSKLLERQETAVLLQSTQKHKGKIKLAPHLKVLLEGLIGEKLLVNLDNHVLVLSLTGRLAQ